MFPARVETLGSCPAPEVIINGGSGGIRRLLVRGGVFGEVQGKDFHLPYAKKNTYTRTHISNTITRI